MKLKILISIVSLEIICLIVLLYFFYANSSFFINYPTNWIEKNELFLTGSNTVKYYYEPKPNRKVQRSLKSLGEKYDYMITNTYNQDTLHEKENILLRKPKDIFRIITLGDSFTFGSNLNTEETYPSQVEKILNTSLHCKNIKRFEIVNLGVLGYDIQYSVERYKIRGQKYDPDLIVWFVIQDDLVRINELMFEKTLQYEQEMKMNGELKKLEEKGIFSANYKRAREDIIRRLGEQKILDLQKKYLSALNTYYDKKLVVTTFPFTKEKYKQILKDFSASRPNIFYYDDLINIYDYDMYFPDYHPNQLGAKAIAQDLANYLIKKSIIPCN